MKSTVKSINETKLEVTCEVDEKPWKEAQEKARKKLYDKLEIKGFRKGHVPPDMAKKYINEGEVFNEAINFVLPDTFAHAMEENKINPLIQPQVNVEKFSTSSLTLKFTVVTAPKVTLGKYQGIKIKKEEVKVTDKEVDDEIKQLLDQNAELILKDGPAKKGDTVILDFEGFVDGKPFEGGKASNYELSLGSGQFIPGFEDQLVGSKKDDKKEVKVKFPENYVENLKGKDATFKCVIHEVKEKKIPELNDEAVKEMKIPNVNSVVELKANKHNEINKRKQGEAENAYYNSLVEEIVKNAKVAVPEEIITEEVKNMKANLNQRIEQSGLKMDQYLQITGQKLEDVEKKMKVDAEKNIKAYLVLEEIASKEKVTVTDADFKAECEHFASLYKMDIKKVEEILGKNPREVKNQIFARKVHDLLVKLNQ